MKQIKFTDGCPNQCAYCYEPKEIKQHNLYDIFDEIKDHKEIQIMDMIMNMIQNFIVRSVVQEEMNVALVKNHP